MTNEELQRANLAALDRAARRAPLTCSFCGWPLDAAFCAGDGPMFCATCRDLGDVLEARPYWRALHVAWLRENDALYWQKRRILREDRDADRRAGLI